MLGLKLTEGHKNMDMSFIEAYSNNLFIVSSSKSISLFTRRREETTVEILRLYDIFYTSDNITLTAEGDGMWAGITFSPS